MAHRDNMLGNSWETNTLHKKPGNNNRSGNGSHAFQTGSAEFGMQSSSSDSSHFMKDQLEHLSKLLQSHLGKSNPSCSWPKQVVILYQLLHISILTILGF